LCCAASPFEFYKFEKFTMSLPDAQTTSADSKFGFLNLMALVLSVYVLIALLVDIIVPLPTEISRMLTIVDNGVCIFFLVEFFIRLFRADNKLKFMKWGWIDLISSIPDVEYLRVGRAFRLIRLLRILRAFRSAKHLMSFVFQNKAKGAFTSVIILAVILVIFSSISILQFESDDPNGNIKTAEDAIWWSYVTITTVGYGDKFPVTSGGRIIGAILMTAGVGLFGTLTAYVSSWFLAKDTNHG
jgi:voltage-gated potassium channel